jgi:NADH-quinone oxidoreductase subunit L
MRHSNFQHGPLGKGLYVVGLVTALLTSFYMFRLWYMTFFGESRSEDPHYHPHESPWSMLGPLSILAVLSLAGGWIGMDRFGSFLAPVVGELADPASLPGGKTLDLTLSVVAVVTALLGLGLAHLFYFKKNDRAANLATSASGVYSLLSHKYWVDELYSNVIVKPLTLGSRYVLGWIGEGVIVRGSAWLLVGVSTLLGEWLRRWQSGNLRSYSAWLVAGAAAVLFFTVVGVVLIGGVDIRMVWAGH